MKCEILEWKCGSLVDINMKRVLLRDRRGMWGKMWNFRILGFNNLNRFIYM